MIRIGVKNMPRVEVRLKVRTLFSVNITVEVDANFGIEF